MSSILLKKFGEILTGVALTWYSQLLARAIETFEEMTDKFVMVHARAKKTETRVNDIFIVKQSLGEGLRDFLVRFNSLCSGETRNEGEVAAKDEELGHKIEDCIALKQEVVNMLRQGHLKELLSDNGRNNFAIGSEHRGPPKPPSLFRTINMIIGGCDNDSINNVKFTATHKLKRSITHEQCDGLEESIIFDELDVDSLTFPHNDALIITFCILDTDVKCIMVDGGSGTCIIHPRVLTQMRLEDKIVPHCITLTGFNNAVERSSGEIMLLFLADGVTLETTFHIMDQATTYNTIVGRSWIYPMRAISFSLYQVSKFPAPWGIFIIRGEKCTYREFYRIALDEIITQQKNNKEKEAQK
uniref:Uncharacterized protein LOC104221040 n=1 Tax=Nicotiana sylvestris TaxID=4096 RepID=A0A1U7VQY4_NICSY|nr:PREDICTED: uncharacterized protein LOC104221040 [Nicotiana sylvestris]